MTTHNALAECRSVLNRQIEFLEHEMGIEAAFPVTIHLLRLSQDIGIRMAREEGKESPCR